MKKSFPFEWECYLAGTAYLIRREKGAYIDLLCYQADKGKLTFEMIKEILNGDFDCSDKIKSKFTEENGFYFNKKLAKVKEGKHKKTQEEITFDRRKIELQLKEKQSQFYELCKPFLVQYSKEMLREFYNYWTEPNKSRTRLRFELERTFEINRRLSTWARNDKGFKKIDKSDVLITYKELLNRFNKGETDVWETYEKIDINGKLMYKRKTITA